MRIVHDTDVASGSIKQNLPPSLLSKIAPHEAAITFVTVGELTRWVFARDLGVRRRDQIEQVISATPKIPAGVDVAAGPFHWRTTCACPPTWCTPRPRR